MSGQTEELWAKEEIRGALARYCRGMDRMDPDLVLGVWHRNGTCDYRDIYEGPIAGLVEVIWEMHRPLLRHTHQITTTIIEVNGDRAASETYVTATLWRQRRVGLLQVEVRGRYLDRWSQRDGRWAIDHRTYVSDLMTTRPVPEGTWSQLHEAASRDTSDPSYELFESIR